MTALYLDPSLVSEVSARLDLREPNKGALETLARAAELHCQKETDETMEGVIELATGVGKTYVMAACLDYFAEQGVRNFAIITPGKTILNKTIANFSPGGRKSLLAGMETQPLLITAENFADGATRAAMADPSKVKLYVFTVQALLGSTGQTARKTRSYQETLGGAFYDWLQNSTDLIVLADEHHIYTGPAFSKAVRELEPRFLFGFTATPGKEARILYRYPLSRAIADKLVKTPVIVGRKDDRTDPLTKLTDGVLLLDWKDKLLKRYCEQHNLPNINPLMLVVAEGIEEAQEYGDVCRSDDFFEGRYRDAVLVVHSKSSDDALQLLESVDQPDSPVRIIINVMLLKEGWDNSQIFVICSMRASVSEVLREQTLGRGLRLPFGHYTEWESLNTLEICAHEKYEELLKKANLLREQLVDYRAKLEEDDKVLEQRFTLPVQVEATADSSVTADSLPTVEVGGAAALTASDAEGGVVLTSMVEREATMAETLKPIVLVPPRADLGQLRVPRLRQAHIQSEFHLADITALPAFKVSGERLAVAPEEELRRTAITGRVDQDHGYVQLMAQQLQEEMTFSSPGQATPLAESRLRLSDLVMAQDIVPQRNEERQALNRILDSFITGLGNEAERVLSANLRRAAAEVSRVIEDEYAKSRGAVHIDEVVEWIAFTKPLEGRPEVSDNPRSSFTKGKGYEGWKRSLYPQAWFDSDPEREVALLLDESSSVRLWLRLQRNYLSILWSGYDQWYQPDFVAVESNGDHWVIEVKAEKDMETDEVQEKRHAAERWANHATAKTSVRWHYLLVSQPQVTAVKGSWPSLRQLASV